MKKNNQMLRFGTGGVPLSAEKRDVLSGLKRLSELGLEHMELEWVYGVRTTKEKALEIGELAGKLGITLTVHAPYYINLNSDDPQKRKKSRQRIVDSCEIGSYAGVKSVCFHPAFYLNQEPEYVFEKVLTEMIQIEGELEKKGLNNILLAPELTGKPSQFGSLEELVALASQLNHTKICFDFAHYFARSIGKNNNYKFFHQALKYIKNEMGLENLHVHFSGIEYSAKGERKHLDLEKSDLNWKEMIKALKDMEVSGYMVCEGPNLEEDALLAKEYYESL